MAEDLLYEGLAYASKYDTIADKQKHIIIHHPTQLFTIKERHGQNAGTLSFDVIMGSYDGLIGLHNLSELQNILSMLLSIPPDHDEMT